MIRQIHIGIMSVALTGLLAGGAVAYAQGPENSGPRGRGFGGPGGPQAGLALRELALTDAQQEQVRQMSQQHREQVRMLNERFEADVRALLTPDQLQKADALRAERDARMKQRREQQQQRRKDRNPA